MKEALPRCILRSPAELALKCLQAWCLGSETFGFEIFRESLDSESKELLDICQDLGTKGYYPASIARLKENTLLDEHIKHISDTLSDDIILKLALLTWHLDASSQSPSEELLKFFAYPEDNVDAVCQILYEKYNANTGRYMQWSEFGEEFMYDLGFLELNMAKGWNLILQLKSQGQLYTE